MPRRKREWYEGACYHVMGRGNRHCAIFKEKEDYLLFLMLLAKVKERYPFTLHAYCLMTNHYHLELTTQTDPIWKIMQPVMNHYARTFNQKNGHQGHLFDSRYHSCSFVQGFGCIQQPDVYDHMRPVKDSKGAG